MLLTRAAAAAQTVEHRVTVEGLRVRGPWHPCRPSPPDSTGESTGTGVTGHSRMPQRAAVKLVGAAISNSTHGRTMHPRGSMHGSTSIL